MTKDFMYLWYTALTMDGFPNNPDGHGHFGRDGIWRCAKISYYEFRIARDIAFCRDIVELNRDTTTNACPLSC